MNSNTIRYSSQKPYINSTSYYDKENFSKAYPPPLQTPSNTNYINNYFSSVKSRSPFGKVVRQQTNNSRHISNYEKNEKSTDRVRKDVIIEESMQRIREQQRTRPTEDIFRELVKENVKLKGSILEKAAEVEDWKKKLCDEKVERKIANKKLETFENRIKELLLENDKLNHSLKSYIEQAFVKFKSQKDSVNIIQDLRVTMTQKDLENRIKALSLENERLFHENEDLMLEVKEKTQRDSERSNSKNNEIKAFDDIKKGLVAEKEEALKELKNIEGQLEQYKAKSKDLEGELLQSHACISDLEKKLKSLMNTESLNNSVISVSRRGGEEEIRNLKAVLNRYKQESGKMQEILENRRKEMDIVKRELDKVKKDNRKLIKIRLDWEENYDKERKEKDEYKELIENQSVILREKEMELDEKLFELDEIKKSFLDMSQQQNS